MGIMTIDGQRVEFTDEPNVLSVIRKAGIDIPTLCYHSELSIYGACRLCTVENERGKTFASCSEKPRDGMVIYTNTPRLMHYRKLIYFDSSSLIEFFTLLYSMYLELLVFNSIISVDILFISFINS